jgi:nucleotide-binding universal stress UspA family protein
MFDKIIVGVDARQGGRDALALAGRLADASGGELVALHVYPYDYFVRGDGHYDAVLHGGAMDAVRGEIDTAGVKARPVAVPSDSPGRALHHAATRENADLIVVGSAHRGRIGRVFAGDVTAGTLHGSPCPVLVAPAGYANGPRALKVVGVGFDGSVESHAAVAMAHEIAEANGADLRVIDVVRPAEPGGPYPVYRPDWDEHARIRREQAEKLVQDAVADLGEGTSGDVASGDPASELAYEGNHLDLLVVGSRGYGPVKRLMLGSTSSKLVHQAPCPVLVLTRTGEDEEEAEASQTTAQTAPGASA